MRRLLVIWTARYIPTCRHHFGTLTGIDKLWVQSHTEWELADALPAFLDQHPEYELVGLAPDDGVFSQQAVDLVFATLLHKIMHNGTRVAVGGWSNCDYTHHYTNIGNPAYDRTEPGTVEAYNLLPIPDVAAQREPFIAGFCGHSLLAMHRTLWLDDATKLHPIGPRPHGSMSDYAQCHRLHNAQVPIWIHPAAHIAHLKLNHLETDTTGWKQLDMTRKILHLERWDNA